MNNKTMFGKNLKYLLVLGALAWMTYTLPSVQAALIPTSYVTTEDMVSAAQVAVTGMYPLVASVPCPTSYPCQATVTAFSVTPSSQNIVSGNTVTLVSQLPASAVLEKLDVTCSNGVSAYIGNANVCGTTQTLGINAPGFSVAVVNVSSQLGLVSFSATAYTSNANAIQTAKAYVGVRPAQL